MATIASAFHIATGALDADQEALNIVANNTANVNTPGYTVERPVWQQNDSVSLNGIGMGAGVSMTAAQSQRSLVLEQAMQQQTQNQSATAARLTALDQMQALFSGATSADTASSGASGIGGDLSSLMGTLSSLEANPADVALRQNVLSAAQTLASDFNGAATQLAGQQQSLDEQSASVVGQVNHLLGQIAQLNIQIETSSPNADAGSLEDQRQQDLTNLAQIIGIHVIPTENNGLTVTTLGGALLVARGEPFAITTAEGGGATHFYDSQGNDITADLTVGGGQLGGMLTARDQDIPQVQSALDTLAYAVASKMNTLNEGGADLNGQPGQAIFSLPASASSSDPSGSAAGITVTMADPAGVAAAAVGNGPADDTNLLLMADPNQYNPRPGVTPTAFFSDLVTTLGSMTSEVSSENTAQQASLTQLQNQIGAISGVNLNDQAAALETLEQSYQAASKLFTVLDQVMLAALNMGVTSAYSG